MPHYARIYNFISDLYLFNVHRVSKKKITLLMKLIQCHGLYSIRHSLPCVEGGRIRDDSVDELLRKQFTKYVHVALSHKRIDYTRRQHTLAMREALAADIDDMSGSFSEEFFSGNMPEDFIEDEGLLRVIFSMSPNEREVLLRCIIQDTDTKTVATGLGLTVRRVQQIRRKILIKLSQSFDKEETDGDELS